MSDHPIKPETGILKEIDSPMMPVSSTDALHSAGSRAPWRLRLQITGEQHDTIGLQIKEQLLIGRSDGISQNIDLDLTPYGAALAGVSRRHAQIIMRNEQLFIEDLASTNHTLLNGFQLEAYRGYQLRDGDELQLGTLRIVIRFVKTPIFEEA